MSDLGHDVVITRRRHQADCDIDGEAVVMSFERPEFYAFNRTASEIWRLTEQPTTVAAIVDDLTSRYRVDGATCTREVCELVDRMTRCGILETASAPCDVPPM
jgi:hypothetical protein